MGLIDQPTMISGGITERVIADRDGALTLLFTATVSSKKYSMCLPIKHDWEKYPDVIEIVRKMAAGYFDLLKTL